VPRVSSRVLVAAAVLLVVAGLLLVFWRQPPEALPAATLAPVPLQSPAKLSGPEPRSPGSLAADVPAQTVLLFGFDRREVEAEEEAKLDDLVSRVRNAGFTWLEAQGHADRIGSQDYNLQLSEERAASVRRVLLARGIAGDAVRIAGLGEASPRSGDACAAMGPERRSNSALVKCLAPDRRVVVHVRR
jgi:OOP family OmpA-OmpF porin